MADEANNYVVGKGKLYFNRFADGTRNGTGERYLGNSPAFGFSQSEETLDHFNADEGLKVKDESVTLSQDTSAKMTLDSISDDNVGLWWLGDVANLTVVGAATVITEVFTGTIRGTYLQLGISDTVPEGSGGITSVDSVEVGASTITSPNNWEADLSTGRVHILIDAVGIPSGSAVTVKYKQGAYTSSRVIAKGRSVYGAMRFIATNPVGKKRNAFMPYVKLAPDGDYALKGDDWQSFDFAIDVLKLGSTRERIYWYG